MLRRSVNVSLTPEEAEALGKWAEAECRDPREQARYFIRKGLGLVPSSADDDAGESDEPVNEIFGDLAMMMAVKLKKVELSVRMDYLRLAHGAPYILYNEKAGKLFLAYMEAHENMIAAIEKCQAALTEVGPFCMAMEPNHEDGED